MPHTKSSWLLCAVALLAMRPAQGTRGGTLRHKGHPEGPASDLAGAAPPSGPFVVQLQRVDARNISGHTHHTRDNFYVGTVAVGHPPQRLQVLFDTASGLLVLPHKACKSQACLEHHRYTPWASSTAADVNQDGMAVQRGSRLARGRVNRTVVTVGLTQADLGHGEAKGVLVRDDVCLIAARGGGQACASLAMLAATSLDDEPFRAMPHDGILGLALEGMAAGALSSVYERFMDGNQQLLPHFSLTLGPTGGEIVFGGHDLDRLAAPLRWFSVLRPEVGWWQVQIQTVRVGNITVDTCPNGCHGVIDTGSSSLGVQMDRARLLLPRLSVERGAGGECRGPSIQLDLGGFSLSLEAEDYVGVDCEPEVGLLDLDAKDFGVVYALGTSVLGHYYTAFDWAAARVGFAPLVGSSAASGPASAVMV